MTIENRINHYLVTSSLQPIHDAANHMVRQFLTNPEIGHLLDPHSPDRHVAATHIVRNARAMAHALRKHAEPEDYMAAVHCADCISNGRPIHDAVADSAVNAYHAAAKRSSSVKNARIVLSHSNKVEANVVGTGGVIVGNHAISGATVAEHVNTAVKNVSHVAGDVAKAAMDHVAAHPIAAAGVAAGAAALAAGAYALHKHNQNKAAAAAKPTTPTPAKPATPATPAKPAAPVVPPKPTPYHPPAPIKPAVTPKPPHAANQASLTDIGNESDDHDKLVAFHHHLAQVLPDMYIGTMTLAKHAYML